MSETLNEARCKLKIILSFQICNLTGCRFCQILKIQPDPTIRSDIRSSLEINIENNVKSDLAELITHFN